MSSSPSQGSLIYGGTNKSNSKYQASPGQQVHHPPMPQGLTNGVKGKMVKVRYKEFNGRAYPVGITGQDLTREQKEWLMLKVLEKEGLSLQEIEELEGGPIFDNDNGSDYRLTVEYNDRDEY